MPPEGLAQGPPDPSPGEAEAWAAVLAAARLARSGPLPSATTAFGLDPAGGLRPLPADDPRAWIVASRDCGWAVADGCPPAGRDLLELYLPTLRMHPYDTVTIGHLGQSLDGCIATRHGESCYVTGPENIRHLHRMRALSDAVIVGAVTVANDDPRLTTRRVAGDNPVRVVLDPRRRLQAARRVFTDHAASTLLVCAEGREEDGRQGQAEVIGVPAPGGGLDLHALVIRLHERGLRRLFVEGGGVSVTAFLAAGLLDRLQVTVAPLLIGEGRRGLSLPSAASLGECLRPACRVFRMGRDVLFDCDPVRTVAQDGGGPGAAIARLL
jgi:riboflavin-specific deaminase-like protein